MSESFETELPRQHKPLGHRAGFIPSWAPEFSQQALQQPVRWQDGTPFVVKGVQVLVGMIPPERRYAVHPDGTMLDQRDFREKHQHYIIDYYRLARAQAEDINAYPIPRVEDFLSWRESPRNPAELVRIGHDPLRPAPQVPKREFNPEDSVVDVDQLSPGWVQAPFDDDSLGGGQESLPEPGPMELLGAQIDQLWKWLAEGQITQEQHDEMKAAVLKDMGMSAPEPAPSRPEPEMVNALCGKPCKGEFGKNAHERRCKACKEQAEAGGPEEAA